MKIGEWESFTTITAIIKKNHQGRSVVVIGDNLEFAAFLEENGLKVSQIFTITNEEEEPETAPAPPEPNAEEEPFDPLSFIKDNHITADDSYVLFTEVKREPALCEELTELGFAQFSDYVFANHGRIIIRRNSPDYEDEYGNRVHCRGCKVFLNDFACNVKIDVDDTASFDEKCYISSRHMGGSEIIIGPDCRFVDNVSLVVVGNGRLNIGAGTKIVMNSGIVVLEGHTVTLGEKCLISYDVKIYSGDGHAIYDSVTRERLNPPIESEKNTITIGNYVWIGMRVVIMNRCQIGDGCIIGAGAVVKGTYPNNCAIGGNPARLLRKNVIWSSDYKDDTIDECPPEYILPTQDP